MEGLGRLLQPAVRIRPGRRIEALGQRQQCLLSSRIGRATRHPFADAGMPLGQKRLAIGRRGALHHCGHRRLRRRHVHRLGRRRAAGFTPLACTAPSASPFVWSAPDTPAARFNVGFDDLLVLADGSPVERDLRVLHLDSSLHVRIERIPPDSNASWRAKHVDYMRPLAMVLAWPVHQVRCLVSPPVADDPQERQQHATAVCAPVRNSTAPSATWP